MRHGRKRLHSDGHDAPPGVVSFDGIIAQCSLRIEPTARAHCDVGPLLHRLHREIFGRLDDATPLATDPCNNGGPVFVVMAPTGLTFLAAPTRAASQRLLPALLCLSFVARR